MGFDVYDYRRDVRNILVTPQIRARFMRMEVDEISGGQVRGKGHSHDLGQEVFLVMQGRVEFEIDGETEVLESGQMCVALVDQTHTLRNVGDKPAIIYLSVTPHIQPTHTRWTEEGGKASPEFNDAATYDVPPDCETPVEELVARQRNAAEALLAAVQVADRAQREQLAAVRRGFVEGENGAALKARAAIWEALGPMFQKMYDLADAWNALTYRTTEAER